MPHQDTLDVAEFSAHLKGVTLPLGLIVDDVRIAGQGIHLEREPFVAKLSAPGRLEVFVSVTALAKFLEAQAPAGLKDFRVEGKDGKLVVRASKTVIVPIPATAVCALRIENGRQLFVELESVEVAGGASIRNLVQNQLDRINPLVDAADLPMVKATLDQVRIEPNGVILSGSVEA